MNLLKNIVILFPVHRKLFNKIFFLHLPVNSINHVLNEDKFGKQIRLLRKLSHQVSHGYIKRTYVELSTSYRFYLDKFETKRTKNRDYIEIIVFYQKLEVLFCSYILYYTSYVWAYIYILYQVNLFLIFYSIHTDILFDFV